MRTYDAAWGAAQDEPAFSNGTEGEIWMTNWCYRCQHEADCPLLLVALMDRTPAEWFEQPEGSADEYHCAEFRDQNGDGSGEPEPQPEPPDMDGLFERPERGVRMLAAERTSIESGTGR